MKRAHGLVLFTLLATGPVLAQAPVDRLQFQIPVTPSVGGWDSSQSNMGSVTFDVIPDPIRPLVAGQWTYQISGELKTFVFQTNMVYTTEAEAVQSGIISTFEGPTYAITGRGDYANPIYGGTGTAVPTNRTIRLEFKSSRAGTFIDNPGQADERRFPINASLRGLPLVAPVNYAGDWAATTRIEASGARRKGLSVVHLVPFTGPEAYTVVDLATPYRPPYGVPTPLAGARRYRMVCPNGGSGIETPCGILMVCVDGCAAGTQTPLMWINPNEVGLFASVTSQSTGSVIYDTGFPSLLTYGNTDQIVIRGTNQAGALVEIQLVRLPTGLFDTNW